MEQFKVKTYMLPKQLKQVWPENTFAYTIECYNTCRTWSDDTIALALFFHISYKQYKELMQTKFDCVEHDCKIFYRTKEQCQEAIKFIDCIKVMSKLL